MGMETLSLEGLIISHPEFQEGLTPVIPTGEIPAHYINRYEAKYEVRCAFCDNHTPHKKGFTVQMQDGRVALCGRDCARHYFGDEVADNFEEKLEKQIRRASKMNIIQKTLKGIPEAIKAITPELVRTEELALSAVSALSATFRDSGMTRFTDSGHFRLKETRRTWVEREDGVGKTKRVPIDTEHTVLEVKAASILRMHGAPSSGLLCALADLEFLSRADASKEFSDIVIDRMTDKRAQAIKNINNGLQFLKLAAQFFTKENIKALSELAKHVHTTAEKIELHKRDHGFDLVITPENYIADSDYWGGQKKITRKISSFESIPSVDSILRPLREGANDA